jgi:symplekin
MRGSVGRIWDGAEELKVDSVVSSQWPDASPTDMWMLLIVRMVTRVAHLDGEQSPVPEDGGDAETKIDFYSRQDNLRQTLCDYIMADFPSRYVVDTASSQIYLLMRQ